MKRRIKGIYINNKGGISSALMFRTGDHPRSMYHTLLPEPLGIVGDSMPDLVDYYQNRQPNYQQLVVGNQLC